jgi:putative hydrolases of HD superfamily
MDTFADHVITLFARLHPLDRVPRAGYLLRGVPEPESVAAHSHFVTLMTMLYVDRYPEQFDARKALAIALLHDMCECHLMDIPMPIADAHLADVKTSAELAITEELFEAFSKHYLAYACEFHAAATPEARLVRGLDKAQMMIKVMCYEREHRGHLDEFWANPKNFNDYGIAPVAQLFDAICRAAGRPRPQ